MSYHPMDLFKKAAGDSGQDPERQGNKGRRFAGYFCSYTPLEIIHAAGFIPVRIDGSARPLEQADNLVPTFLCPYLRQALEKGLEGRYDRLSGLVQGYTCDAACGLMDIWRENVGGTFFHTIPLPYNDNPDSRRYLKQALNELTTKLEEAGGRITDERLHESWELYNGIRTYLKKLYELRYQGLCALNSREILTVVSAGGKTPPEEYREMLTELLAWPGLEKKGGDKGFPVIVSGSLIDPPDVMDLIEDAGARVTADDLCTGLRWFYPPEGRGETVLDRIIDRHMSRFPCPARSRAVERAPLLIDLARRTGAGGVIFLLQKFCTPHLADYPILSEELSRAGINSILIELDDAGAGSGQLKTRLESFLEMLTS